jgi:leucyl aminopeptidase
MKVEVTTRRPTELSADALLAPLWKTERVPGFLHGVDRAMGGALQRALDQKDFKGKPGEILVLPAPDLPVGRVTLLGLGEEGLGAEALRRAAGAGTRMLMGRGGRVGVLAVPHVRGVDAERVAQALTEGAILGSYRFDRYRTAEDLPRAPDTLYLASDSREGAALGRGVRVGTIIAESTNLARDLSNEPGSVHTPAWLAERARELARGLGLRARIFGPRELEGAKMAGILTVGRGSEHTPRLIELEYRPRGADHKATVALVGKGITFDTGGISLKPAASMEEMKHDMSGGAAVLGAIRAAALLKLPVRLVGLVAAAENKPGPTAYLPGDVVRSASGKTIEVLSTDAEGRIVLADALHHASSFHPDAIIDVATLTGACIVALGTHCSAVIGNDEPLVRQIREAGERASERVWPLPLWEEYKEQVKGQVGDLKNTGGREGGTITAGAFLSHFVGSTRWAHLDIAGTAFTKKDLAYCPPGATGVGVRLLTDLLRSWPAGGKRGGAARAASRRRAKSQDQRGGAARAASHVSPVRARAAARSGSARVPLAARPSALRRAKSQDQRGAAARAASHVSPVRARAAARSGSARVPLAARPSALRRAKSQDQRGGAARAASHVSPATGVGGHARRASRAVHKDRRAARPSALRRVKSKTSKRGAER